MYRNFIEPSELENKAKWIRCYKLVIVFLLVVCIVGFVISLVECIIHLWLTLYYVVSLILLFLETILFYLEVRCIHNSDLSLQEKVVKMSVLNFMVLTTWEFVGGILLLDSSTGIGAGITTCIITGLFLLCNIQVRNNLAGKSYGFSKSDFTTNA